MVSLLLSLIIFLLIANIFATRFFVKRLSEKIELLYKKTQEDSTSSVIPLPINPPEMRPQLHADKPSKNTVMETDENEIELNENTPMQIPPEVKVEVEGGDSVVPPGFTVKTN